MINYVECYRSKQDQIPLIPIIENYPQKIRKVIKTKISCSANPNHIIPIQISRDQIEYDFNIMDDVLHMEKNKNNIIKLLLADEELSEEYSYLINSFVLEDTISAGIHIRVLLDMVMWKSLFSKIFKDKAEKNLYIKNNWTPTIMAVEHVNENRDKQDCQSILKELKDIKKNFKRDIGPKIIKFFKSTNFLSAYKDANNKYLEEAIIGCYKYFSGIIHDSDNLDSGGARKKRVSVKDIINGGDLETFFLIVEKALG